MLKTVAAAACFAVPALVLTACSSPEQPATSPGTTPSIWTGSPSPAAPPGEHGGGHGGTGGEAAGETLTADLKNAEGTTVATAQIAFSGNYATVTVETAAPGELAPGFHGLHIHSVGKCEPNSVAPAGGAPGDFNSAGGHLQV
ncbi:superoxide dismutase family protein, partial [Mycolicibacter minnesotensis]|uniref:superoxide dismutase family protein n=2 Tax=Mycobacteriaceae TaxID=1762 RepID=UPI0021F3BFDE